MPWCLLYSFSFFFNDTATTEIYALSLHDALPIFPQVPCFKIGSIESFGLRFSEPFIRPCPATKGKSLTLSFFKTSYLCNRESLASTSLLFNSSKKQSILPSAKIPSQIGRAHV